MHCVKEMLNKYLLNKLSYMPWNSGSITHELYQFEQITDSLSSYL